MKSLVAFDMRRWFFGVEAGVRRIVSLGQNWTGTEKDSPLKLSCFADLAGLLSFSNGGFGVIGQFLAPRLCFDPGYFLFVSDYSRCY